MDINDVYSVGSDIVNAVNDAVGSGDYSKLNETLKNVTGTAAGTAADALYNLQDHLQRGGNGRDAGAQNAGGAAGGRTYGHAGRSTTNMTEEYMKRARGARHHTVFSSKVSPFLQRRISRGSGNGRIIGGIVSFVFAGYALIESLASGLIGTLMPFGGTFFSAWTIVSLVITGGLAILGGILIKRGQERKRLVREYYEYGKVAGTSEYIEISKLAHAVGESRETVLNNLEKMISEEMLPASWFDRQKTTLILSEELYNEYLRLERERQAQEEQEAKARMQQEAANGTGSFDSAAEGLPEDLRLRPEDAKLPEDARKIVEEGLLYIGRIRAYNEMIADAEVTEELSQLEITMARILEQIRKDPSTAPNLRRLMVYYLPTTMKLLQAYQELDQQTVSGENVQKTRKEIRDALGTINIAFENLLDSLFQDMAWDISSDISVMKSMMAQDGLTGEKIRRPEDYIQSAGEGLTGAGAPVAQTAPEASSVQYGAQPAQGGQPAAGEASFDSYTEGFTEGLAEEGTGGAAYARAPEPAAAASADAAKTEDTEKKEQGIRLTFGE